MAAAVGNLLLSEDEIALEIVSYIIQKGLESKPDEVAGWARTLIARLETRQLTTESERLQRVLDGSSIKKPVVLDDVLPQPETIEEMRVRAIADQAKLQVLAELAKYSEVRGHDGLTASERLDERMGKLQNRMESLRKSREQEGKFLYD